MNNDCGRGRVVSYSEEDGLTQRTEVIATDVRKRWTEREGFVVYKRELVNRSMSLTFRSRNQGGLTLRQSQQLQDEITRGQLQIVQQLGALYLRI